MKSINELTEQEILNLSSEDIDKMIKTRMAEEGIKFIEYPEEPTYHEVPKPTSKTYYCHLLGQKLSFTDMNELTSVLEVLSNCRTMRSVDCNYELPDGYKYYMMGKVENASWSSEAPDTIVPVKAYTHKEYIDIKDKLNENAKNKKEFQAKVKEYGSAVKDAQWVKDEIMERINEVVSKYDTLDTYIYRFKNEYLPLSDNNEDVAMNFMDKAYSLTSDQQKYVLENYNNI